MNIETRLKGVRVGFYIEEKGGDIFLNLDEEHVVSAEKFTEVENKLEAAVGELFDANQELAEQHTTYKELLEKYEELKFRVEGLEK